MNFFKTIEKFHHILLVSLRVLIYVSFLTATVIYLSQTFFRIFFNINPFSSFNFFINYSFVLAALSGAIYNIHLNENISISVLNFVNRNKIIQLITDSVSFLLSLLMLHIFFVYFKQFFYESWIENIFYIYLFFISTFSYFYKILTIFFKKVQS